MDRPLAGMRVEEACRHIALRYLGDATRARGRLEDPEDTEALHDLRVGLRRLRSLERAYRPQLQDSISTKLRKRLRALAASTNVARDTEVQIEWLGHQREHLNPRHRRGLEWMGGWLEQRKTAAYADVRREVAANFDAFTQKIEPRLHRYTAQLAEQPVRFGDVTGQLLIDHVEDLAAKLGKIQSAFDDEPAHDARIAAKRLRYLVEPLRGELAGAEEIVSHMKSLQDLLGELHDVAVLSGELGRGLEEASAERARHQHQVAMGVHATEPELRRDARPGIMALSHRVRERRDELFAGLTRKWLGDEIHSLVQQCRELADRCKQFSHP
jgi:CHAD domain-containing protein